MIDKSDVITSLNNYEFDNLMLAIAPSVERVVEATGRWMRKKGFPWTERDMEHCRLSAIGDLLKALGNYVVSTDEITVIRSDVDYGKVEVLLHIKREGTTHHLKTRTIVANGLVYAQHLRYIVDTTLYKLRVNRIHAAYQAKRNRMKKADRIAKDIEQAEQNFASQVADIQRQIDMTDQEIIVYSKLDKWTWERLNEFAKANYLDQAEFDAEIDKKKRQAIAQHKESNNQRRITYITKDHKKRIEKMQKKLAELNSDPSK